MRAAFTKDTDLFAEAGVTYLDGLLDLEDKPLLRRQMFEMWDPMLGLSWEENERAIQAGTETLADYEKTVRSAARAALDGLEREKRLGILLLGRPYHHDPGLNHGIPEELQKLGYAVFSQSTLPLDEDMLERLFGDEMREGLIRHPMDISDVWKHSLAASSNLKIWAAKFAARHPNLVAVELSNFKCGHDAPIYATIEEIIETVGHAVLRVQGHRREQAGRRDQAAARDDRLLARSGRGNRCSIAGGRPSGSRSGWRPTSGACGGSLARPCRTAARRPPSSR